MQVLTRNTYSLEEKANAVRDILNGKKTRREIKDELNVAKTETVTRWIREFLNDRDRFAVKADIPKTKYCSKCNRTLPVEMFWKNRREKDGFQFYCKECMMDYCKSNETNTETPSNDAVISDTDKIRKNIDIIIDALIDLRDLVVKQAQMELPF